MSGRVSHLNYRLHYCKGQYFRVNCSKSYLIKRLIYPIPKPKSAGLGVYATLDLSGDVRLGSDEKCLKDKNKDYLVDDSQGDNFCSSANRLLFINKNDFSADTDGIRPKLKGDAENLRDFVIEEEAENGLKGFVNLVDIESLGLTTFPAIAITIEGMIKT